MKKRFWKIEYSITIFVIFAIALLLMPSSFITSKGASYISRWNETFNKMDYIFTAMNAQADAEILKSFKNAKTNDEREQLMIKLVKPYMRISENDALQKRYEPHYMNGSKIEPDDRYYFDKFYVSENNIIVGIKDIIDDDILHPGFIMMFDMNGISGPNVWGKDIYGISIYKDGKIRPLGYENSIEELKQDCSEQGTGVTCSHYYRIGGDFNEG